MTTGSSGGLETDDVVGGLESVKIVEVKGMGICGRETPKEIFGGSEGMEEIGIVFVIGEDGGVVV